MPVRIGKIMLMLALLGGCAADIGSGNPYPPVPAPMPEAMTKPPVTAEPMLWQPGHWDWTGSGYTWAPGQWVSSAGHGDRFMPGWWSKTGDGWVWQAPHWTS